jgi:mRNA-degrading endonuclease toxin of MazEF toxin-antitoxin module
VVTVIFEIWYYKAVLPNNGGIKPRPVLVIGDDGANELRIVDVHYCLVTSSGECGKFDVLIDEPAAKQIGLTRKSIIKITKIFTGSRNLLERKVADLPESLRSEVREKYAAYQRGIIERMA